jgi:hypothetical protein
MLSSIIGVEGALAASTSRVLVHSQHEAYMLTLRR